MATEVVPDTSGGGTFTPVGDFIETTGLSFTWEPAAVGNILAVIAFSEDAGQPVTGISTPTNATWAQIVNGVKTGSSTVTEATAFVGTAASTSSETVTLATGATAGDLRVLAHEFAVNGTDVALDGFVSMDGDVSGEVTAWPPATASRNDSELLFGFERNFGDGGGAAVAGDTAGVTYYVDANSNGGAFATGVSGAVTVGWDDTDSRTVLAVLLYATPSGGGSSGGGEHGGQHRNGGAVSGEVPSTLRLTGKAVRDMVPLEAYKSISENVTSSITLQNDDALLLQLEAGAVYYFECVLGYTGAATGSGDLKLTWKLPDDAVMNYAVYGRNAGVATNGYWETQPSVPGLNSNGTTPVELVMAGPSRPPRRKQARCSCSGRSTPAAPTPTTVLAGSSLLAWRIG